MMAKIDRFDGPYFFLSNFYPSPLTVSGITYPTLEHAFQAAKTEDQQLRSRIAALPTPAGAKRAGRTLALRPNWDELRIRAMRWLLLQKFAPGTELAQRLIDTGTAELIEGNTWGDRYWGTVNGVGENWLGRLLMERREGLVGLERLAGGWPP